MGASLTMIDRHYGHLARDGREHAIRLLDELSAGRTSTVDAGGRCVDTEFRGRRQHETTETAAKQAENSKPSDGLEPSTPSLPWRCSTS